MNPKDPIKEARQRKFLLFFPLLAVPCITLLFWTLGGGATTEKEPEKGQHSAVNMALPDASFEKENPRDKMSFYAQAFADSAQKDKLHQLDPYYGQAGGAATLPGTAYASAGLNHAAYGPGGYGDPNEARIYNRLGELNAVLNQPAAATAGPTAYGATAGVTAPTVSSADIDRLEQMMHLMSEGGGRTDPEMQQINTMLERIMDIQHPERAQEKINSDKLRKRGQVYAVTPMVSSDPVSMIPVGGKLQRSSGDGFYSLTQGADAAESNSIAAVVHDNQAIVSGSIVKLRLTADIMIGSVLIPKDNFLFGEANISGERLNIEIHSIRYANSIFPVQLKVFDLDGLDGIHIPGAITRDVVKESSGDMMGNLGMGSLDPGLAAQAASAGIELSKNLLKRKIKLVKVNLKAGYKLLLKDQGQDSQN